MRRTWFVVLLLLASPAYAEPTLLAEVTRDAKNWPDLTMKFSVWGGLPTPSFGLYQPARTFTGILAATPEELAAITPQLMNDANLFQMNLNNSRGYYPVGALFVTGTVETVFDHHAAGPAEITSYVPQLVPGSGFTGYRITGISQEPRDRPGQLSDLQHILRVYGEPIPEPATWLLVAIGMVAFAVSWYDLA